MVFYIFVCQKHYTIFALKKTTVVFLNAQKFFKRSFELEMCMAQDGAQTPIKLNEKSVTIFVVTLCVFI